MTPTPTPIPWATLTPISTPNPAATQVIDITFLQGADVTFAEVIVQRYNQFNHAGVLDTFMFLLLIMFVLWGFWSVTRRLQRLR